MKCVIRVRENYFLAGFLAPREELGTLGTSKTTKKLMLHVDEDKDAVIFHLASRGEEQMIETMLNHLDTEDRKEVQSKVDRYLHEKFKTPPKRPF